MLPRMRIDHAEIKTAIWSKVQSPFGAFKSDSFLYVFGIEIIFSRNFQCITYYLLTLESCSAPSNMHQEYPDPTFAGRSKKTHFAFSLSSLFQRHNPNGNSTVIRPFSVLPLPSPLSASISSLSLSPSRFKPLPREPALPSQRKTRA